MKKLSLLIAMILCVTIGGVYAVWTYSGTNDIADVSTEAKVTMADFTLTGAAGVYTVSSNLVLTVDQATKKDHDAKLVFSSNNDQEIYLKITFTPSEDADNTIKESGVETTLTFTTTTAMTYKMDEDGNYDENGEETPIFTFGLPIDIVWVPQDDGSFLYTMNEAALAENIKLSQTFILDIKHEYDMFKAALSGNIIAKVSDGNVTQ